MIHSSDDVQMPFRYPPAFSASTERDHSGSVIDGSVLRHGETDILRLTYQVS